MALAARHPPKFKRLTLQLGAGFKEPTFSDWPDMWQQRSRDLWAQLHRRALLAFTDDTAWLTAFAYRLPCGECRSHFWALVLAAPPTWGERYFGWTVRLHNSVNLKLGKALWAETAACAHWSYLSSFPSRDTLALVKP